MKSLAKILLILSSSLILIAVIAGFGLYYWAAEDLPKIEKITDYSPPLTTTITSTNGKVLGYLAKEDRFLCSLKEMPPCLPKAFLAAEDSGFYEHPGVDIYGIFRAAIKNIEAGTIVQGGSTITQQVIKSLLLTPKRSYQRKLKEAILAYRLEKFLNKDEILTIYLNQIYLGHGAYGVEAASRAYFAKHASELNLAEAALLAGLPKAPSLYDPYRHPQKSLQRQRYVLCQLRNIDWISEQEYKKALNTSLEFKSMDDPSWEIGAYYLEEVRRWLVERFGEQMTYTGGLQVKTAVNLKHQKYAEEALRQGLIASSKRRGWQGPVKNLRAKNATSPDMANNFLKRLESGQMIKAVVKEVDQYGADVSFGNQTGRIDVHTMAWCRQPDPEKAPEEVSPISDARKILQKGDVVWASQLDKDIEELWPMSRIRSKQFQDIDVNREDNIWDLQLEQRPKVQGALVSLQPETGLVRALVGGSSFSRSQYNRATQAKRQTGSAFKPIVYSAALDNGFTPASLLLDAPIVFRDVLHNSTWKPENYERTSYGRTLFRTALVKSRNLVTIRIAREIGIDTVIQRAKALGLRSDFPRDLSLSLGSASVSLMNLCHAYTGFAKGGSIVQPRLVQKVTNSWGKVLYTSEKKTKSVISSQTAYIINYLLQKVVQEGTGWRVKALNRPVAGKTGTTDEQRDAWFLGYAPYLLTGVYVGFDEPKTMGKYETGSRAAAPIWLKYRQAVEDKYPARDFNRPSGIVMAKIDASNGLLAGSGTEKSYLLPFKSGTQPQKISQSRRHEKDYEQGSGNGTSEQGGLKEIF